jgi:hypothetical protein
MAVRLRPVWQDRIRARVAGTAARAVPAETPVTVAAAEPAIKPRTVRRVNSGLTEDSLWCWRGGGCTRSTQRPFP